MAARTDQVSALLKAIESGASEPVAVINPQNTFNTNGVQLLRPRIGFDIFRFENGQIVEHWDNLQETAGPNPSGRTMIDGSATSYPAWALRSKRWPRRV